MKLIHSLVWLFLVCLFAKSEEPGKGVVIESVGTGSVLEKAGVQPGDILLTWERMDEGAYSKGAFETVFDWYWFVDEVAPRGPLALHLERSESMEMLWVVPGFYEADVRPRMTDPQLQEYQEGKRFIDKSNLIEMTNQWKRIHTEEWSISCWLQLQTAICWLNAGEWLPALKHYQGALKKSEDKKAILAIHDQYAKGLQDLGLRDEAEGLYCKLLEIRETKWPNSLGVAKSYNNMGRFAFKREQLEKAEAYAVKSLLLYDRYAPMSLGQSTSLQLIGVIQTKRKHIDTAHYYFSEVLALREYLAPRSHHHASILNCMGTVAWHKGKLSKAEDYYRTALNIQNILTPKSHVLTPYLSNLGLLASIQGEANRAEDYYLQALAIEENLSEANLSQADILSKLGTLSLSQSALDKAHNYYTGSHHIIREKAPDSPVLARILLHLGSVTFEKGLLDRARTHFENSRLVLEKCSTDHPDILAAVLGSLGSLSLEIGEIEEAEDYSEKALQLLNYRWADNKLKEVTLHNLGAIAWHQGKLEKAEHLYQSVIDIHSTTSPLNIDMSNTLCNMAFVAIDQGDLEKAAEFAQKAMDIVVKIDPNSSARAACFKVFGDLAWQRGRFTEAESCYREEEFLRETHMPNTLEHANALLNLGIIAYKKNDYILAKEIFTYSYAIKNEIAPESLMLTRCLYGLALVHKKMGNINTAIELLEKCFFIFESKLPNLEFNDRKGLTLATLEASYRAYIDTLKEAGQFKKAFFVSENLRARGLLKLLAERDFHFSKGLDRISDLRKLNYQYDHILQKMWGLDVFTPKREIFERRLQEVSLNLQEIKGSIRRSQLDLSVLVDPNPQSSDQTLASLEEGTVILSYIVTDINVLLFILKRDHKVEVITIPKDNDSMRMRIDNFNADIERTWLGKSAVRLFQKNSAHLFDLLIRPAKGVISESDRILIIPDGPLWDLPFTALGEGQGKDFRYLAEWKPVTTVVSATVYSSLKRRKKDRPTRIVAFGDPVYPNDVHSDGRSAGVRDFFKEMNPVKLQRLPATGSEVQSIAAIFPDQSITYLRQYATEEQAKALGKESTIIHFACHGVIDDENPLNSGVALTIPKTFGEGQDNGILQVREIFESVNIDSDLLFLSACNTARGKQAGGDGLIGLTRAFQYAGARSIVASQWRVDDAATAALVKQFYTYLKKGDDKATALQKAQLDLLKRRVTVKQTGWSRWLGSKRPDYSAPYYWAAFQLIGPWD